jgi:alpha-beta hydrolase superfamily lysophospholipase
VTAPAGAPLVVLLHGLARREGSMATLGRALEAAGFATWARTYPSRRMSIADAARTVADWIAAAAAGRPLYAVTHSLGGILVRHMADPRLDWRRIVMLAPPSQGSTLAAAMADNPLFRWFYGPAGQELRDGSAWPAPPAPFAVIAGTRRRMLTNPTSWTIARKFGADRDHDGTVAVDETHLPGMAAYAEIDATHTWIMNHPDAHARVIAFLRAGRF